MDTRYNGWNNYETWNAKLWIDNDQGECEYWDEQADDCLSDADGDQGDAVEYLSARLEDYHAENMPELSGVYADLLQASLRAIDWREIAGSMIGEAVERAKENAE